MNQTVKQHKMGQTLSTMAPHTKSSFMLFPPRPRAQKRLNSTVKLDDPLPHKFSLVAERSMSWNKWKVHNFPSPWQGFQGILKQKVERKAKKENQQIQKQGPQELKLRRKIREVLRLKEDIQRARHNKELILAIEDYHENRINSFFDQLQKHLDQ